MYAMRMYRCSECYNNKTGHKKMAMKTVTKDETASHDDKVATSVVAPIVDIAIFMK